MFFPDKPDEKKRIGLRSDELSDPKVLELREKNKRVIGCWRIAPNFSESDEDAKGLRCLASEINKLDKNSMDKIFLVTAFNESIALLYEIVYISPLPDSGFILTLSVFSWESRKRLFVAGDDHSVTDEIKNCVDLHKLIPHDKVISAIKQILINKCEEKAITFRNFSIELAANHYSEFLTPSKAEYCEWNRCCSEGKNSKIENVVELIYFFYMYSILLSNNLSIVLFLSGWFAYHT